MNEDDIDIKIKDFSNYLLDIGLLIGGSTYNEFGNKFKEINEKEKILFEDEEEPDKKFNLTFFKDNICKTMIKFYESMNEERKKLITHNIFNIYNKKKEGNKNNDSNYVINKNELLIINEEDEEKLDEHKITSRRDMNKEKEYKEEHFEIILLSSKNNLILDLNDSSDNKSEINSKGTFNNYFNKKKNKKEKKEEKKEEKKNNIKNKHEKLILNENCTFQPNLDKKQKKNKKEEKKNLTELFVKLSKKSKKKEEEIENIRKELDKECIFQPNLESNNKNKDKKKINRKDFDKRLKLFEENKKDREEKRKKEEEKEFNDKFPFAPNKDRHRNHSFNKSFNNSFNKKRNESFTSDNIYQRLHEEKNKIQIKYEENLKKVMDDIKDRANHPIVKHNNINYITRRKWNREPDRKIYNIKNSFDKRGMIFYNTEEKKEDIKLYNNKRIEELYEEYKNMKKELKVEQKQINDGDNKGNNENANEDENINKIKGKINISMTNNEENNIEKNEEEIKEIKNKDSNKSLPKDNENNSLNNVNN